MVRTSTLCSCLRSPTHKVKAGLLGLNCWFLTQFVDWLICTPLWIRRLHKCWSCISQILPCWTLFRSSCQSRQDHATAALPLWISSLWRQQRNSQRPNGASTPRSLSCFLSECWIVAAVYVFGYNSSQDFANKQVVDCFPEAEGEKVACLANGTMYGVFGRIPSATKQPTTSSRPLPVHISISGSVSLSMSISILLSTGNRLGVLVRLCSWWSIGSVGWLGVSEMTLFTAHSARVNWQTANTDCWLKPHWAKVSWLLSPLVWTDHCRSYRRKIH